MRIPGGVRRPSWIVGSARLTAVELAAMPNQINQLPAASAPPILVGPFAWYQFNFPNGSERTIAATLDADPVTITDGHLSVATGTVNLLPSAFNAASRR